MVGQCTRGDTHGGEGRLAVCWLHFSFPSSFVLLHWYQYTGLVALFLLSHTFSHTYQVTCRGREIYDLVCAFTLDHIIFTPGHIATIEPLLEATMHRIDSAVNFTPLYDFHTKTLSLSPQKPWFLSLCWFGGSWFQWNIVQSKQTGKLLSNQYILHRSKMLNLFNM